jgi:hypothetical protein
MRFKGRFPGALMRKVPNLNGAESVDSFMQAVNPKGNLVAFTDC